jgi:hypothetical protein
MKGKDADVNKGAIEDAPQGQSHPGESHNRMANQLGHRDADEDVKDNS